MNLLYKVNKKLMQRKIIKNSMIPVGLPIRSNIFNLKFDKDNPLYSIKRYLKEIEIYENAMEKFFNLLT
jgi:hypothetical protein